jgi:hypothetical protein
LAIVKIAGLGKDWRAPGDKKKKGGKKERKKEEE